MTAPTPEQIEAAAAAVCLLDYGVDWERMGEAGREPCRAVATAALSAAAPFIAAQAKAEAWDAAVAALKSSIGAYTSEGVWAIEQVERHARNPYRAATIEGGA